MTVRLNKVDLRGSEPISNIARLRQVRGRGTCTGDDVLVLDIMTSYLVDRVDDAACLRPMHKRRSAVSDVNGQNGGRDCQ